VCARKISSLLFYSHILLLCKEKRKNLHPLPVPPTHVDLFTLGCAPHSPLTTHHYHTQHLTMQQQAARQSGRRVVFRNEGIGRPRLANVSLPSNITYGVELEGFYPSNVDVTTLQSALRGAPGWRCARLTHACTSAAAPVRSRRSLCLPCRRVKNDNSIVCNPRVPSCYKAELVSPVLRGTQGLDSIYTVLGAVKGHRPSVNKTTGLHVHVRTAHLRCTCRVITYVLCSDPAFCSLLRRWACKAAGSWPS
jgi:hypothetical protein